MSVVVIPSTATAPSRNTTVNPVTNSAAAPATRRRAVFTPTAPDAASDSSTPTTAARYDRYPGTNGTTHGDANDTSPASTLTPRASSTGPAAAISANPVMVAPPPALRSIPKPSAPRPAADPRPAVPAGTPRPRGAGGPAPRSTG